MALSKELEEELTCPIDLEYFVEPVQLKCLHLLCEKDVEHMMDEDELIQCPVCNRVSEKRDIKKDFRAKRLIEIVQGDQNKLHEEQVCVCEEESAVSWCRNCKVYLGKQCLKTHKIVAVTKDHQLDPIVNIMADSKEQIQKYILEIKRKASEYEQTKEQLVKTKDRKGSCPLFAKIRESEEAIINETRRAHEDLRKQLQTELNKGNANIDEIISDVDSKLDIFRRKVQILRDVLQSDDKKTLLNKEFINELVDPSLIAQDKFAYEQFPPSVVEMPDITLSSREKVIYELRQLQLAIGTTTRIPSANTSTGLAERSGAIPKMRVNLLQFHTAIGRAEPLPAISSPNEEVQEQGLHRMDFAKLTKKAMHSKIVHHFEGVPISISIIMDEIWIVLDSGEIQILKETSNKCVKKVRSVVINQHVNKMCDELDITTLKAFSATATADGTIIAACLGPFDEDDESSDEDEKEEDDEDGNGKDYEDEYEKSHNCEDVGKRKTQLPGLVAINSNGVIHDVIALGVYAVVRHSGGSIFGLRIRFCDEEEIADRITVHKKQQQNWCEFRSISLETPANSFIVLKHTIMLSCHDASTITTYDIESATQQQLAEEGDKVGEVDEPRVSCCDKEGNVLICDMKNNRIQVLLVDNTWAVLNIGEEGLYNPFDAAVSNKGRVYFLDCSDKLNLLSYK